MRLKWTILNIFMALMLFTPLTISSAPVYAASGGGSPSCGNIDTSKGQVLQGVGLTGSHCDDSQVNQVFRTIVQILSIVVGITSVMVIIYAGFKYITSGGEQGRVANAKSTLLYAIIGLAVAALAQVMIHFVLFQTNKV
jgi:uncharacterized membrane protein YuzA (DUF378 family)